MVVVYDLKAAPGTPPAVVESPEWIVTSIRWVKNDVLVLNVKSSQVGVGNLLRTWVRAIAVDADGKNGRILMSNEVTLDNNTYTADIVDIMPGDPDRVLMSLYRYHDTNHDSASAGLRKFYLDLLSVNVRSGSSRVFKTANEDTVAWITDGQGTVLGSRERGKELQTEKLYLLSGDRAELAGTFELQGDKRSGFEGVTEDGKAFARRERVGGFYKLLRHDLATGAESELFSPPGFDVANVLFDEWSGRISGVVYPAARLEYHFFDPKRQALQRGIEQAMPGKAAGVVSSDLNADKLVVAVAGASEPTDYYLLDRATHNMRALAHTYPSLADVQLGEMKPYDYVARDGLHIPAYLTLPPGRTPSGLPLVVLPHGGPDGRDMLGFDWWAQFLASRGYAVLQPNYRGSSGYGDAFAQAGLRQWGLKMQDDVSDGVKKAVADGIADPKRVCIVGADYGGYAALAGAAFTPELYACAIAVGGVSDLPRMLRSEHRAAGGNSMEPGFWATRIGSSDENWDQLVATSPARHADKIRAPILLLHGEGDTTVRIDQSEVMASALKAAGKQAEFLRIAGADHYMNQTATRVQILQETERFLAKNIGK